MFAVEHVFTGGLFALKLMRAHLGASAEAIQRFQREARAVSKIRSRHVVRIFDADIAPECGGAPYLVMDLLEGSDLEQLSHGKPVPAEDVLEWLRQVATALDRAHRIGIIHRDLKPENLFLTRLDDGTSVVKILDFGIARIPAESPGTTQAGQIFGTPQYMAPEQARGEPALMGPATDLYGLGQIAYCLLTGTSYRTQTNLGDMLNEILNKPLQAPSERGCALGPEFDEWFLRACHAEPARRYDSAYDQVEALARALGLPTVSKIPDSADVRQSPTPYFGPTSSGPPRTGVPSLRPDSGVVSPSPSLPAAVVKDVALQEVTVRSSPGALPTTTLREARDGLDEEALLRRRSKAPAVIAAALLLGLPLLAFALAERKAPPVAVVWPRPSACPVEPAIASVAVADLPQAPPLAAADIPDTPRPSTAVPARSPDPPVRAAAPVRTIPARTVTTRRSPVDDDPLSDQQ